MRPPAWPAAMALALLAAAAATAQAPHPLVSEVRAGDADVGQDLRSGIAAAIGFIDANGNGRLDGAGGAGPDEPVYLDFDNSRSVSYGDLRLTPFGRYPSGTVVDVANRDMDRSLVASQGWFGRAGADWFVDIDATTTVSVSDLAFAGGSAAKVAAGHPAIGQALASAQKGSLWWADRKDNAPRGLLDAAYIDRDSGAGALRVSVSDLRIVPQALGADDEATPADIDAALARLATSAPPAGTETGGGASASAAETGAPASAPAPAAAAWRTLDWILVVVGVANLAGLIVVGRLAAARHPKNPFK